MDEWIVRLNSDDFRTRQEASEKLAIAGRGSLDKLVAAAKEAKLEVAVRIVQILEEMYVTIEDLTLADKVEEALEQLEASRNSSVASRSERVLSEHYDVREKRALAKIEQLGGQVIYRETETGVPAPELRDLQFVVIGNNWTGGDDGLKYLRRVERLRVLYLSYPVRKADAKPPVSDEALQDLRAALPDLMVQFRGKAYLGIGPMNDFNGIPGCRVGRVQPGTAAEKAGIVPGDLITSFGGKDVPDFDALIELIKEYGPGDSVKVVVRRPDAAVTLDVTLTGWEASAEPQPANRPPVLPPNIPRP